MKDESVIRPDLIKRFTPSSYVTSRLGSFAQVYYCYCCDNMCYIRLGIPLTRIAVTNRFMTTFYCSIDVLVLLSMLILD
uniref:Hypotheticial protein n=1 Tax=Schistosoma japonicum TaxID=6182 RepID=C1LEH8_SCHJA|nr:hypotheticial protein [Schistosoma japonicum]